MRISFTGQAEADLAAVFDYIAKDSEAAARQVLARILLAIQKLERFPHLGRSGRVLGTRELSISGLPYFAVYRQIGDGDLEVVTIIHERRRFPPKL